MEIYLVLKNNMKRSYKKRLLVVILILLPALVTIFSNAVSEVITPTIRIGVITDKKDTLYNEAIQKLNSMNGLSCDMANKSSMNTDLILGTYHYIIDLRETENADNIQVISYQKQEDKNKFLNQVKVLISDGEGATSDFGIAEQDRISNTQRLFSFMLTLMIITATINASSIIVDKKNKSIERFTFAPTSCLAYLLGNMLFSIIIAALQLLVTYGFMSLLHLTTHISIIDFLMMAIIMILISTAIGILVTCFSDSELKANIFSSCIAVLFSILGGAFLSFEKMPEIIQKVSVISPIRWIMKVANYMEHGYGYLRISYLMIILSIVSCILILISTVILKKRIIQ
jgi:ABC-2 type transport system permease protein